MLAVDLFKQNRGFFSNFFNDALTSCSQKQERGEVFSPKCDILDEGDRYVLNMDVPGIDKKDIQVVLKGHVLHVKGESKKKYKKEDENRCYIERFYGSFERKFWLDDNVQEANIHAAYEGGLLKLVVPKKTPVKPEVKKISIH